MASLNDIANNYFKKNGTISFVGKKFNASTPAETGGISQTRAIFQIRNSCDHGLNVSFGSGANTCIGGGESMDSWLSHDDSKNGEKLFLLSDETIIIKTGCQNGYANGKQSTFNADGTFTSAKVYNAVWNDYAEFYPKGEETEPGDIIMLDINSKEEKYVKATEGSTTVVGVHSDSYGHLIGGDEVPLGEDFVEYNSKKYIPVGLVGRVYCKVIGKINKGDRIVVSEIPGVGRKFDAEKDNVFQIVGMSVENKESLQIDKIKVNFRAGGG